MQYKRYSSAFACRKLRKVMTLVTPGISSIFGLLILGLLLSRSRFFSGSKKRNVLSVGTTEHFAHVMRPTLANTMFITFGGLGAHYTFGNFVSFILCRPTVYGKKERQNYLTSCRRKNGSAITCHYKCGGRISFSYFSSFAVYSDKARSEINKFSTLRILR